MFLMSTNYWLGKKLHEFGKVYLRFIFKTHPHLTASVNNVLLIGFYMLTMGAVSILASFPYSTTQLFTQLQEACTRIGTVYMVLGAWHFINMIILLFIHIKQFQLWKI